MAKNRPAKKDNNKEKKGKKEKGVGKRMKKEAMIQAIISVFQSSPKEPFNYKQISKIIGVENQVQKLQVVDILTCPPRISSPRSTVAVTVSTDWAP